MNSRQRTRNHKATNELDIDQVRRMVGLVQVRSAPSRTCSGFLTFRNSQVWFPKSVGSNLSAVPFLCTPSCHSADGNINCQGSNNKRIEAALDGLR